jgi:hypothetical protein
MNAEHRKAGGCRPWFVRAVVWGFVLLFVAIAFPQTGVWMIFELLIGWIGFLKRILPQISANWDLIGMALVCLAGFFAGSHWFLKWMWTALAERRRELEDIGSKPTATTTPWKPRWTLAINGLVWMSFLIGMSSIGIVHQAGWMAASEEPVMVVKRGGNSPQMMANLIFVTFVSEDIRDRQGLESAVKEMKTRDTLDRLISRVAADQVRAYLLVNDAGTVHGAIAFRTVYSGQFYGQIGVYDSREKPARKSMEREQLLEIMRRYQDELYPFL